MHISKTPAINGGQATTSGNKRTYVRRRVANARNGGKRARTGQNADVNNNNRVVDDDIEITEVVTNTVKTCDNFMENASLVMRVDQVQFVQAHKKLLKKIQSVAMLRDNFKMDSWFPGGVGLRAQQLRRTLDRISPIKIEEKLTTFKELKPFLSKVSYEAPDERIIISWNITRDSRDICPMISDVPEEALDSLEISETSSFSYTFPLQWRATKNIVSQPSRPELRSSSSSETSFLKAAFPKVTSTTPSKSPICRRSSKNNSPSGLSCLSHKKKRFRRLYAQRRYMNPKSSGNMARLFSHSCEPKMELVRVFQKSFSPAHIRLFLDTSEDFFPGTELTIDNGDIYCKGENQGNL